MTSTHRSFGEALAKPVIDYCWQTETGSPILSSVPGVEQTPIKIGDSSYLFLALIVFAVIMLAAPTTLPEGARGRACAPA